MKLGQLIRMGGLALVLGAGTLAGCDDDDPPIPGKADASDAGGDGSTTDGSSPDAVPRVDATVDGGATDGATDAVDAAADAAADGATDGATAG